VALVIRLGEAADVEAAVSVFERSNLARRHGRAPRRATGDRARAQLHQPASWFLVMEDESGLVAMASAEPLRAEDGAGPVIPEGCFLHSLFVVPERWGEGIGGALLDAVLAEAKRQGYSRIVLWTHEDNERAHRLYRSRNFSPTNRSRHGQGEWTREI
jgi:GNAT superfamily N-acetyltransferase